MHGATIKIINEKTARTFPTKHTNTLLEYKCTDEIYENHKMSLWETIQQETMLRQKDPPV
jgi:hypothetical protein